MMTENEIKKIFLEKEAMLEGHFQLTSGRHSDTYLQCAKVLMYPDVAERLGEELVARIREENAGVPLKVHAVCSPALGGIILGHVVARALKVRAIFAERENGQLTFRRGFELKAGESVIAVEDVITTGGSLKEIVQLSQAAGARVISVGSVAERSATPVQFGAPKTVLLKIPLRDYAPAECPLCKQGLPVVKPGSRKA
jgi:orotate phosphoribosyltransferase